MKQNILAPSVGESITEVSILKWAKNEGEAVKVGELLVEIESDKATVEVVAEAAGALTVLKQPGERARIGEILGFIDSEQSGRSVGAPAIASPPGPRILSKAASGPAVNKLVAEKGLDFTQIPATGRDGRLTKADVIDFSTAKARPAPAAPDRQASGRTGERRVPMTSIRRRIAERLVQAQHTAAILTTFNEVDMKPIMEIRTKYKDAFQAKHALPLSFMSFFTRGCVEALKLNPDINAAIDGEDVVYHDTYDMGIAVGTERGLVVPVVRGAEALDFLGIEKAIALLATKARAGKLSIDEMSGGTFTISNGGVYGSLLSTPILNPPQSAILGMHKIQDRPIVIEGRIEIRPMMYLALSYDHRLIDGKGAVVFLIALKDFLEHPEKLGLDFVHGL